MTDQFVVKATSPGLDPDRQLQSHMPVGSVFEEYDPTRPLIEQVGTANAFLTRSVPITRDIIDAAPALRLIQRPGAHVEAVDIDHASLRGIPVCHVPPSLTPVGHAVAEHALFLILALAKLLPASQRSIAGEVVGAPSTLTLAGKTLGLVGMGRTATDLVPMARAIGMRVIAVKRTVESPEARESGLEWLGPMEMLPQLLAQSDVVSLHLPLTPETDGLFDRELLSLVKTGSFLVNTSRGAIVDRDALLHALRHGHLAGVGLDVVWAEPIDPGDPIFAFPNVVVTPHIAGATRESREAVCAVILRNIELVAAGKPPMFAVNQALPTLASDV